MARADATLAGGCHCGALRFHLDWPEPEPELPARRCSCSFCTRFNGTWTSHPAARLELVSRVSEPPIRYRFATGTADFLICGTCGIAVAAIDATGDGLRAVVNVNTLDRPLRCELSHSTSRFDGESRTRRLARRQSAWIGRVDWREV